MTEPSAENPPDATPSLQYVLSPLPVAQFMQEYWPNRHLAIHGSQDRLKALTGLPQLADIQALLREWRALVQVFPGKLGDEYLGPLVAPDQAKRLFEQGSTIVLSGVEIAIPVLRRWLATIVTDLGLPRNTFARCIVYASASGTGALTHFDAQANLVVQLRGEKLWRVAPNRSVVNPTDRYATNMPQLSSQLRLYAQTVPRINAEDMTSIQMKAGSVLFVPRGLWHATVATEDSLSLNFTFSQPTWIDILLQGLRRRLLKEARWRELADGAGAADPERQAAARQRLASLLEEFGVAAGTLDAATLLAEVEPEPSPLGFFQLTDLKRDWTRSPGTGNNPR